MLTNKKTQNDSSMIKLKVEHAIQIILLICGMFGVWSASVARIDSNAAKIQSQKEYIERIDKNVGRLIQHFVDKGIKN